MFTTGDTSALVEFEQKNRRQPLRRRKVRLE